MAEPVHLLKSAADGTYLAKCGVGVTRAKRQPPTMSAWHQDVTCDACLLTATGVAT